MIIAIYVFALSLIILARACFYRWIWPGVPWDWKHMAKKVNLSEQLPLKMYHAWTVEVMQKIAEPQFGEVCFVETEGKVYYYTGKEWLVAMQTINPKTILKNPLFKKS